MNFHAKLRTFLAEKIEKIIVIGYLFLGATFKFKDSIRERFGKEFEQDRTSSLETLQRRSAAAAADSYGLTTSNPMMGLESGSSRKRAGRSSSEHFEETKNSLHYSKDYKLNHSHHHQQLQKKVF